MKCSTRTIRHISSIRRSTRKPLDSRERLIPKGFGRLRQAIEGPVDERIPAPGVLSRRKFRLLAQNSDAGSSRSAGTAPRGSAYHKQLRIMPLREPFELALQSLWGNKMRTILTLIGVVMGVASVIMVITMVNGANRYGAT